MKKVTKTTFKKFINENIENLYIKVCSRFDAMTDCVMPELENGFSKVSETTLLSVDNHTLGIKGLWVVGNSRDWFSLFETMNMKGIQITNCCGTQVLAVMK